MTPRRVLMTADTVSDVWAYALELSRGLSAVGIEVMLVVIGPEPSPPQRAEAIAIPGLVLIVPGLELKSQDHPRPLSGGERERLRGLAGAFEADIVHCNGFREAAAGFLAPVLVAAHPGCRTKGRGLGVADRRSAYADGVRSGLHRASLVVAPTQAFFAEFSAAWGPQSRSSVIHYGMDVAGAQDGILIAGCTWDAESLSDPQEDAAGLPGSAWLGRSSHSDASRAIDDTASFAAPTPAEPSGFSILHAAKSGCSLVLGDLPSLVELWGDAARFVPANDADALRRTLQELADDREARHRLRTAASERARRFPRSAMVSGYLQAYRSLSSPTAPRVRAA